MTEVLKVLMSVACCFVLSGCAALTQPWPAEGAGGFAEWHPIYDQRAAELDARLETARARGAERYDAGAFADAELLLTRSRREIDAGLNLDADADLDKLASQTVAIEKDLGRLKTSQPKRTS